MHINRPVRFRTSQRISALKIEIPGDLKGPFPLCWVIGRLMKSQEDLAIFLLHSILPALLSIVLIFIHQVADTRPPGMRPNYTDASLVAKYELPPAEYEKRVDSVLAWKKANKLGRFDPVCNLEFFMQLCLSNILASRVCRFKLVGVRMHFHNSLQTSEMLLAAMEQC